MDTDDYHEVVMDLCTALGLDASEEQILGLTFTIAPDSARLEVLRRVGPSEVIQLTKFARRVKFEEEDDDG